MINAYDKTKNQILLETSLKILGWIIENNYDNKNEIYLLNKFQVIKRMRKLDDNEILQLLTIISSNKENKIFIDTYLLLGNLDMAKYYFRKLSESEQIDYKKLPINIFWEEAPVKID